VQKQLSNVSVQSIFSLYESSAKSDRNQVEKCLIYVESFLEIFPFLPVAGVCLYLYWKLLEIFPFFPFVKYVLSLLEAFWRSFLAVAGVSYPVYSGIETCCRL